MIVTDILLQPFDWVDIPGGSVTLETGKTDTIADFAIAKYPITNAQYQVFVDAKEGYPDMTWWDYSGDAKISRKKSPKPEAAAFAGSDHPRTNVNWFDAVAFCRWLNETLTPDPSPSGRGERTSQIMLPTEQQWQWAAQGDTCWAYPWGDEFDASRCNFNSEGTTPVTKYENGVSQYGVMDMSGNAWEWCLTEYQNRDINFGFNKGQVLRGGSWRVSDSDNLRVAYRGRLYPNRSGNGISFRPACSY